jgi:hypothetical protein
MSAVRLCALMMNEYDLRATVRLLNSTPRKRALLLNIVLNIYAQAELGL